MELKSRGVQGWPSIIRQRTAHGRTVAPDDFGFRAVQDLLLRTQGIYDWRRKPGPVVVSDGDDAQEPG